mmetsp:Transcript_21916/g.42638  ORF Transcript_21916/g.42638 Transcript_21916/m.42638 type:complete len:222 (-) Transcript_21916:1632-2297(-)
MMQSLHAHNPVLRRRVIEQAVLGETVLPYDDLALVVISTSVLCVLVRSACVGIRAILIRRNNRALEIPILQKVQVGVIQAKQMNVFFTLPQDFGFLIHQCVKLCLGFLGETLDLDSKLSRFFQFNLQSLELLGIIRHHRELLGLQQSLDVQFQFLGSRYTLLDHVRSRRIFEIHVIEIDALEHSPFLAIVVIAPLSLPCVPGGGSGCFECRHCGSHCRVDI